MFHEMFALPGYLTYVLFAAGFFFVIRGADVLVDGASSLARHFGVSVFVIGLTVVAMGTSIPELVVSIQAGIQGDTDLIIGNVLGSNVANLALIIGLMALIAPVFVGRKIVRKELPISLLAIFVVLFLANQLLGGGSGYLEISREDGAILLTFLAMFSYYVYTIARRGEPKKEVEEIAKTVHPTKTFVLKPLALVVLGVIGLWVGGGWIVDGASEIAAQFGVSSTLIGLTIVAVGTSIPEIATTVMAARKKIADLAVGNLVGSNILNIFMVLGVASVLTPIPFRFGLNFEIGAVIFVTTLMLAFLLLSGRVWGRRYELKRWQGAALLAVYIAFIVITVFRG